MNLPWRSIGSCVLALFCSAPLVALGAVEQNACAQGDQALAGARWDEAYRAYRLCVRTNPSYGVYSNMGMALSHMGRMDDAIASYDKALSLAPDNSHIEFNLAVTDLKAGQYAAAVEHLKRLQRAASDARYDELLAFSYYHLGLYAQAAQAGERVYAVHPEDAANALILGSTYTRMGQYEKAMPLITLALQAAGSAEGHMILAETLIGLHRFTRANEELKQVAAINPDFPGLHAAMGEILVSSYHLDWAETEFMQALHQDPKDFEANYFMGRLKRLDGDLTEAETYLNVADQLRPNSSEVAYERAEIFIKQHRYAEAMPLLKFVIEAEPDQAQAYLMLAEAYQRTGQRKEAQVEGELYNSKRREAHDQAEAQMRAQSPEQP